MRNDIDPNKVFVHGRSLGGAVTVYVMTKQLARRVRGVILENTFTSIADMVDHIFPKLKFFKGLVQRNFWPSIDRIRSIEHPILFIHSTKDEIVPPEQMKILQSAAKLA